MLAVALWLGLLLGVARNGRACVLPQPIPPVLPLVEAMREAPVVVYGHITSAPSPGPFPTKPIEMRLFCSWSDGMDGRSMIEIVLESTVASCSGTAFMEGQHYIATLYEEEDGRFRVFEANEVTPASWEPTMENLENVVTTSCSSAEEAPDSPIRCPAPPSECSPQETEIPDQEENEKNEEDNDASIVTQEPAAAAVGSGNGSDVIRSASSGVIAFMAGLAIALLVM